MPLLYSLFFSLAQNIVVQLISHIWLFATLWTTAHQTSLSFISWSSLKLMSLSWWCYITVSSSVTLFSSCPQSFPVRVFSSESTHWIRWPKLWSFSFSFSPSNEYSGMISFRIDWFDLPAVQGTLKSLLQHRNSTASILQHSAFMVQLSHPYMTTGKTIALTRQTFVSKLMSLLFNTLSRFVIAFLPRSKRLMISWLQLQSTLILEPKKIKSVTVSIVSPSVCHEVMGLVAMILVFWMLSFKSAFSLSSFTIIKRLFSSSSLSAIRLVTSGYLRLLIISPGNLDSSFCFIQPSISHDVLCM